jgi:hypothetical protein
VGPAPPQNARVQQRGRLQQLCTTRSCASGPVCGKAG